jgi:transducin (beta)-like 1
MTSIEVACAGRQEQMDVTSLDWNFDGTLLAIGCFDSTVRIVDGNGQLWFAHPQHLVSFFHKQSVSC